MTSCVCSCQITMVALVLHNLARDRMKTIENMICTTSPTISLHILFKVWSIPGKLISIIPVLNSGCTHHNVAVFFCATLYDPHENYCLHTDVLHALCNKSGQLCHVFQYNGQVPVCLACIEQRTSAKLGQLSL